MAKERLDVLVTTRGLISSRSKAQALIMAGKVRVDGQVITKVGTQVSSQADIKLDEGLPYVSRGGTKLAAALDAFNLSLDKAICADIGASTGGFTDVLLQYGAAYVYAIDVGYGQLAWKLRQDERVIVMERTNARYLDSLPKPINFATIDASFISLKLLLPTVIKWLATPATIVVLVKPQFEAGKKQVGKGGVVRDQVVHRQVLEDTILHAGQLGLKALGCIPSPITGPAGNHEFLLHLGWQTEIQQPDLAALIDTCLKQLQTS